MLPCLSQITTFKAPLAQSLDAYAQAGWTAIELWLGAMESVFDAGETVDQAASAFRSAGLRPVAAAGQGGLFAPPGPQREASWTLYRRRLGWLQALGVPVLVLAPDFPDRPTGDDLARAADSFAAAAAEALAHGVRLALEPQKTAPFCASLDTALAFVAHCDASSAGVCLDLFHFYTGPSKSEDLALLTPQTLLHVQVCDLSGVPREMAADTDRILPGEGDLPVEAVLSHLDRTLGYTGAVSVETLNPTLRQMPVDRVAYFARQAIDRVLPASTQARPSVAEPEP
jgi:sugar phosphate isomerase/epimerase